MTKTPLDNLSNDGFLTGKILLSMPAIHDSRFEESVIFVCGHDSKGAIGLMINKIIPTLHFGELLDQIDVPLIDQSRRDNTLYYGGPLEVSRGFVLHTPDFSSASTVHVNKYFSVTATVDILRALAKGQGPSQYRIALGYTGWSDGQIEMEITDNNWLVFDSVPEMVFEGRYELKWRDTLKMQGIDPGALSPNAGHA